MNYDKAPFPWFADGTVTIDDANGRSLPYSRTPTASDRQTEMKRRRAEGALFREIADEFGISVSHAHRLVGTEVER